MTNTLRTTWITVFSIIAMLMSSYASSSSAMMSDIMMLEMSSGNSACHVMGEQAHAEHSNMNTHDLMAQCDMSSMSEDSDHMMGNHCSGADCCASVCSANCYPIQDVQAANPFTSSLARFQSVTIGQKVARAQSLLRPPTA
ncbi:hypothetical protein OH460_18625 [Vibrio sp. Makdt]|uniref:hypothetical protein n=1 Tax=Vibrio sp. Makdt TaxID=2998828 RepID=UPI0022CD831B|nr:hypothetical protein [Vibrio sp. Makdt]MDA0154342.1 hypothetical protein [Vibrio sp. Makdt]